MSYLYISHMVIHFIYKKRRRTYITTPLLYPLWYLYPFLPKNASTKKLRQCTERASFSVFADPL